MEHKIKHFKIKKYSGIQHIGSVGQPPPLFSSKTFPFLQNQALCKPSRYSPRLTTQPQGNRQSAFLYLWIYLLWIFYINGVMRRVIFMSGLFLLECF